MPIYKAPVDRETISRKPGETSRDLNFKYRNAAITLLDEEEASPWESVSKGSFAQTKSTDYKPPSKYGVMTEKMKVQARSFAIPTPINGPSTHKADFNVTKGDTLRFYETPLRQAPSEIAMAKGSAFPKPGKGEDVTKWIPRELLQKEKERLKRIVKRDVEESPMTRLNLPGYSGHEPQSPKNAQGPFRPGIQTTSGRANAQGLGALIS